jgi:hypothetical protein
MSDRVRLRKRTEEGQDRGESTDGGKRHQHGEHLQRHEASLLPRVEETPHRM